MFTFLLGMAFHASFVTKYTTALGPRTTVSVREYTDGRCKVCFFQTYFKKQEGYNCERTLSLSVEAWCKMDQFLWQIDQVVDDLKNEGDSKLDLELSDDVRLRVNASYPFINIRKFWSPPNRKDKIPTTRGVCIQFNEYEVLKTVISNISAMLPRTNYAEKNNKKVNRVSRSLENISLDETI